jgi:hypothetical protein
MDVFRHMAYEIEKGVRSLVLYTGDSDESKIIENYLDRKGIPFCIDKVGSRKINVFFGTPECLEVLRGFSSLKLNKLTSEEDFILGIMLGYDLRLQCIRYSQRRPEPLRQHSYFPGLKNSESNAVMVAGLRT